MTEPRLRYDLPPAHVVARDSKRGVILFGGLGGMGLGQMWGVEQDHHKKREGYAEAEIVDTADLPLFGLAHPWIAEQ